ncbi:YfjL-like protein [Bacillus sp. FSL K6-3431]|uniref:YfjL-like protein n=1 Tax=Bacillus sp. FSL K6-3431 TaxID=2921500 RepID=UPI0030FCF018
MSMKKKKWLYTILLIILIVPILFFYQAFNGNPVSKIAAKNSLQGYLTRQYPHKEYRMLNQFYDFKIGGYTFEVVQIGDEQQEKYEFQVTGFFKPTITFDGIYYANLDEPLMEKLSREAVDELKSVFHDNGIQIVDMYVQLEISQGKYTGNTIWSKGLQLEKPMYIHLTIDVTNMNKKDVLAAVKSIQQTLDSENYQYSRVSFNGNIIDKSTIGKNYNGYVKYHIGFDKGANIELSDIETEKQ